MPVRDVGSPGANPIIPPNFIPADCPIIAQHWFGLRPTNNDAHARNLRFERHVEHLHRLGPRPVLEALIEVADGHDLDRVLAAFARLDPKIVRDLDGDRFTPSVFAVART